MTSTIKEQPQSALTITLSDEGKPSGLVAKVYGPDNPDYQEVSIAIFDESGHCCGDVLVGVDPNGELRVAITSDNSGDGDKNITVFPARPTDQAVEVNRPNHRSTPKHT